MTFIRFNVSLWALVANCFCNYLLGLVLRDWRLFL